MVGRPKGTPKTGGRKVGTRNKSHKERFGLIEAGGLTPLEYMLQVLRDKTLETNTRMDAASKAAPYVHARLSTVELGAASDAAVAVPVVVNVTVTDARKSDA